MSLDLLISKYIDGELSTDEDFQLRQLVKESPDAKVQFDSAILLNAAFKKDAGSIKAPAEIVSETEDLILMKIMSAASVQPPTSRTKPKLVFPFRFSWAAAMSFAVMVLVIGGIFTISEISDYQIDYSNSSVAAVQPSSQAQDYASSHAIALTAGTQKNNAYKRVAKSSRSSIASGGSAASISNVSYNGGSLGLELNSIAAAMPMEVEASQYNADMQSSEQPSSFSNSSNDRHIISAATLSLNSPSVKLSDFSNRKLPSPIIANSIFEQLDVISSPIRLTSYYSRDVANKTKKYKNSSPISSYSQSVGYSIADNLKLGIEFGATDYTFDYATVVKVPSDYRDMLDSKLEIGSYHSNDLSLPIKINHDAQLYWFSTYLDYDFLSSSLFNLQSRVGAGMSVEGALLYTRLMAELHIYKGIYFNFGAEAKGFDAKITNGRNAFIGTGSMIYGVQVKLSD